ncbi:MAG: hypothetical protein WCA64_09685 [Gallionella sp.]
MQQAVEAGQHSGERLRPFPIDNNYESALESRVADIKQCTLDGNAGHILAARFMKRFAENDTPWLVLACQPAAARVGWAASRVK